MRGESQQLRKIRFEFVKSTLRALATFKHVCNTFNWAVIVESCKRPPSFPSPGHVTSEAPLRGRGDSWGGGATSVEVNQFSKILNEKGAMPNLGKLNENSAKNSLN